MGKSLEDKISDDELKKAYTAGVLDSDGSIGIGANKRKRYQPQITVVNTNEKIIEYMQENYGENISKQNSKRSREGQHKMAYVWRITNMQGILKFLYKIRSYLIIKKDRADLMIEYCESREGGKTSGGKYSGYTNREKEIYEEMKKMNQKGDKSRK